MMISTLLPAILVLLVVAGIAVALERRASSSAFKQISFVVALSGIGLAFAALGFGEQVLTALGIVSFRSGGLRQLQAMLYLLAVGLDLLLKLTKDDDLASRSARGALAAAAAGLVALSSQNLFVVALALLLYASIRPNDRVGRPEHGREVAVLGGVAMLFGAALVYVQTGSWSAAAVSKLLWPSAGPGDPLLLLGMALVLGGVAFSAVLIDTGDHERSPQSSSTLLGVATLLLLLTAWFGGIHLQAQAIMGLLAGVAFAGSVLGYWRHDRAWALAATTRFRVTFLLFALALSWRREGMLVLLVLQIEHLLAVLALSPYKSGASMVHGDAPDKKSPFWHVLPAVVTCLSVASVIGTLGFAARGRLMLGLARSADWWWLVGGVTLGLWGAWLGLRQSLLWVTEPSSRPKVSANTLTLALASVAATLLLVAGLASSQLLVLLKGLLAVR